MVQGFTVSPPLCLHKMHKPCYYIQMQKENCGMRDLDISTTNIFSNLATRKWSMVYLKFSFEKVFVQVSHLGSIQKKCLTRRSL